MATIKAFIKKHKVLTYYGMVFTISWGSLLLIASGPYQIPGTKEQVDRLFPIALLSLFAGPSVSGILMNGLVSGRAGLRELFSRLLQWRVAARWYAIAVLFAPLLVTAVLLALSLISTEYLPGLITTSDKVGLLVFGIAWGLIGGAGLDGIRCAQSQEALQYHHHWAHRGHPMGNLALPYSFLVKRQFSRRNPLGHLRGRVPHLLSGSIACL